MLHTTVVTYLCYIEMNAYIYFIIYCMSSRCILAIGLTGEDDCISMILTLHCDEMTSYLCNPELGKANYGKMSPLKLEKEEILKTLHQ